MSNEKYKKYRKEYYKTHPEAVLKRKEYMKNSIKTEKTLLKEKEWRIKNKNKIKQHRKEYYKTHPEAVLKRKEYMKNFIKTHPEVQKYQKDWRKINKNKLKEYNKNQYNNNAKHKLIIILRARIGKALKYNLKSKNTKKLLGCSIEELKQHLEKQFKEGMNWTNNTQFGWHIDHIVPCDKFDLSKEEEQSKCFHYTNLQPLWWKENLTKSNQKQINI